MKTVIIVFILAIILPLAYITVRRAFLNMIDRRIERFQSELIEKQVLEIRNMYKQIRGWRHDYRNHIQNMKILLAKGDGDSLDKYLSELADDLDTVDTVIKTGNVMADAILNSKLSAAEKLNIRLNVKANIPKEIPLSDVELCAVMGNLLDNAVEACAPLPESERFMRIYIGTLKNQFYLSIQNSAGKVKKADGKYISTKPDSKSHGYGIFRVDRVVRKYGGYVRRHDEEGVFATELLVPIF